jgi:hypothetical protein
MTDPTVYFAIATASIGAVLFVWTLTWKEDK